MLENLNIHLAKTKAFQDHQHFEPQLLEKLAENQSLFMTEKDAVKCQAFAKENWWYVPVDAEIVEAENQGQNFHNCGKNSSFGLTYSSEICVRNLILDY